MSAVQDVLLKDKRIQIAGADQLRLVMQIIPFLEQRNIAAKKYMEYKNLEEAEKNISHQIDYCNNEIISILGLHYPNQ